MDGAQSAFGWIGLTLMLLGIVLVIVWSLSAVRQRYAKLGPVGFTLAIVGLIVYLVGGYMGGR